MFSAARGSSSKPAPAPAPARPMATAAKPPPPAPAPVAQAPPPMMQSAPQGGGMMSGLMGTMASGMAFGAGSAIAHKAVDAAASAMTGGSAPKPAAPVAPAVDGPCFAEQTNFTKCLQNYNNDATMCTSFFQNLTSCQTDAKAFA